MRWPIVLAMLAVLCLRCVSAAAADRWFASSDGVRLHYTETGPARAPTIVLVPGWTMPGWIFQKQIDAFSRQYRVLAFDPRSQGASDIAPGGHNQDRRGKDIAELLAVATDKPVLLVGWSLGVLDSLAYLHADGDAHLAGLVLVDNSVGEDPPPPKHPMHAGPHLPRDVMMRNFVRHMFATPQPQPWLDKLTQTCLRTPERAAEALLAYPVPRTYWKEAVFSTGRPVLYVVTPRLAGQAENLRQHRPNAESVVLTGVGHALFVDDAPGFDTLLSDFIHRRVWR